MTGDRALTSLPNIGKKLAARLGEIGIASEAALRAIGPVEAHRRLKARYPHETLPVCYYLYSLEGALTDQHWDAIGETRKVELRRQAEGLQVEVK